MYLNLLVFYFNVCFLPQGHKHSLYSLLRGFLKKRQISEVSTSVTSLEKGTVLAIMFYLLNPTHCTYILGLQGSTGYYSGV